MNNISTEQLKKITDVAKTAIIVVGVLIGMWLLGQAIVWFDYEIEESRTRCIEQTKNWQYCYEAY